MSDFYKYFKENMDSLGLAAPESIFGSLQAAVGAATTLLGYIDKFGKRVTVRELIRAGTKAEWLATVGAYSVAFYVGAVIGSIAVATGRTLAGGTSISDVLLTVNRHGLYRPWLDTLIRRYSGIYDSKVAARSNYRHWNLV